MKFTEEIIVLNKNSLLEILIFYIKQTWWYVSNWSFFTLVSMIKNKLTTRNSTSNRVNKLIDFEAKGKLLECNVDFIWSYKWALSISRNSDWVNNELISDLIKSEELKIL